MADTRFEMYRRRISTLWIVWRRTATDFIKKRLNPRENWQMKLFALALAVFLWMLAAMGHRESIRLPVQLRLSGLAPDLIILEQTAEKLDITVSGPLRVINAITADQINLSYDLSDIKTPQERTIRILPEKIQTPAGTAVTSIMPASVVVRLGRKKTVYAPVELEIKGKPAPDYTIVSSTSQPDIVKLEGPESVLEDGVSVKTEAINVEGATESFASKAYLIPIHPLVRFSGDKSVLVRIEVHEKTKIAKFSSVLIQQVPPERAVSIVPPRINLDLRGPMSVLRDLKEDDLIGVVDVMDLGVGRYLRTPRFLLPEGTSVKSRDPDKVTVIVKTNDVRGVSQ